MIVFHVAGEAYGVCSAGVSGAARGAEVRAHGADHSTKSAA